MPSRQNERDIEFYLVRRVLKAGGDTRKVQWIGRAGAPDRLVLLPGGIACWVELKASGKLPRPGQFREHQMLRRLGQRVEVIDSIEGVDMLMEALLDVA